VFIQIILIFRQSKWNKDDEILNNQMKSYLSTKSKNSKAGKIINSYHNLVQQSSNFNAKSFIDAVLNPPSVSAPFKLDLSNKNEKEIQTTEDQGQGKKCTFPTKFNDWSIFIKDER
jgi:hypothetical protein